MLNNKTNLVLVAVRAVQVVVAGIGFWPKDAQAGGELLLTNRVGEEIVGLEIVDGDGNRLVLAEIGGLWVLPEADAFPVDSDKVVPLLGKIEGLRTSRLVTMTKDSHARLQVDDREFNRRLQIKWSDGSQDTLLLGSSAGAGATHFRLLDRDEVYLTADMTPWEANTAASHYIDTQFFSLPSDVITFIKLVNQNGAFTFEKINEEWVWEDLASDEVFDESGLTRLLSQVSSVRMISPLGTEEMPSYGFEAPQATVIIRAEIDDALQEHVLTVGAEREDEFLFRASGEEYYATVSSYTAKQLIEKTSTDFIENPPVLEGG